jgi:proliferating cell nuclear antigen
MLEASRIQARLFKNIVNAIKELSNDVTFKCDTSGINVQVMDNAHVSLVQVVLKNNAFQRFVCDQNLSFCVALNKLCKVLSWAANDDEVSFSATDGALTLKITIESTNRLRVCEFELILINVQPDFLNIPYLEYQATIYMHTNQFKSICNDLSLLYNDRVTFSISRERVVFSITPPFGEGSITIFPYDDIMIVANDKSIQMTYHLKYLKHFYTVMVSKQVTLCFNDNTPMCVDYQLENNLGFVRYYLAPCLEQ